MFIIYNIFRFFAWLISKLPFCLLYIISDILYFLIYYLVGYRKKVTLNNLRNSFPDKSDKEIKSIAKKFYMNFSDTIMEVIKIRSITKKSLNKRVRFNNFEIIEELYKRNKNVFITLGHCGNWEWLGLNVSLNALHSPFAIVKPLNNPFFEKYITKLRTKYYNNLIPIKQTYRTLINNKNELCFVLIVSDQSPAKSEINHWTTFLNQETPVYLGTEKISKALDYAVVFSDIQRIKRGYYEVTVMEITDNPKETTEYEITEKYYRLLEEAIKKHPDNWLWSHRRWKHKKVDN